MASLSNSILIVDADNDFSSSLSNSFQKTGWVVHTAMDGLQAVQYTHTYLPDIIIMNTELPVRDGITTCSIIKNDVKIPGYFPVIMMNDSPDRSLIMKSIDAGCDDFILKPFKFSALLDKVNNLVEFFDDQEIVESQKGIDEVEIIAYFRQVVERIFTNTIQGKLIDYPPIKKIVTRMISILHKENNLPLVFKIKSYNDYTYVHSMNVASLSMSFAYHLKWNDIDLQIVGEGALLHDIGTSLIGLKILMKPDKLTDTEFSEMKKHPLHGKNILAKQLDIQDKAEMVVTEHHERVDGSGYPKKLRAGQISKYGKLVAIVDVYDALTTDKSYKKAVDSVEAIKIMSDLSGQFEPEYIEEFANLVNSETIGK